MVKDADYDRAKDLLEEQASDNEVDSPVWVCSGCGEKHIGLFTACWKCGRERGSASGSLELSAEREVVQDDKPLFSDFVKGLALGVIVVLAGSTVRDYFLLRTDEFDRNGDGKADVVYVYDRNKVVGVKYDHDFDGHYETIYTYDRNGDTLKGTIDRYRTGKPDIIQYYTHGKTDSVEYFDRETGKLRKRATYKFDVKVKEEIDQDGDGVFEKVVKFDEYENPIP